MKNITMLLVLSLIGIKATAATLPAEKVEAYKASVTLALSQKPVACVFTPQGTTFDHGDLSGYINEFMTSAETDNTTLPTITFSGVDSTGARQIAKVILTADHKSISSVEISQSTSSTEQINVGTIDDPKIITKTVWTISVSAVCQ